MESPGCRALRPLLAVPSPCYCSAAAGPPERKRKKRRRRKRRRIVSDRPLLLDTRQLRPQKNPQLKHMSHDQSDETTATAMMR